MGLIKLKQLSIVYYKLISILRDIKKRISEIHIQINNFPGGTFSEALKFVHSSTIVLSKNFKLYFFSQKFSNINAIKNVHFITMHLDS